MSLLPLGELARGLEALKLQLAGMSASDLSPAETAALEREISAIRLQLKRLRSEQGALKESLQHLNA